MLQRFFYVIDARVTQTSYINVLTTVICRFIYIFDLIRFNLYKTKRSHLTIIKSKIQEFRILRGNLS